MTNETIATETTEAVGEFPIDELLSDGITNTPPSFVRAILKAASDPEVTSFAGGLPNPISFPQEKLLESMQRVVAERGPEAFQYSVTAGVPELRAWIAERYNHRFGTDYTEEDVLVTTGSQQVREVLAGRNIVVVEDDPYGELRFEGDSLPYIGGTALPHGVIMGSFSKTVTPGFRMGYLLTKDHDLLRALNTAKEAADLHTNVFAQFVVLDYLRHNDLDEHLVKIRELYRTQARAMTDAMAEFFPAEVSFTKPQGGMFLWATLPEGLNTMDLFPKALERNVAFVPGEPFYAQPGAYSTMRLNFTNADADTIRDGIQRLGEVIAAAL